jgi:hypothetical protein
LIIIAANRFTSAFFDLLSASFAWAISALLAASVMAAICSSLSAGGAGAASAVAAGAAAVELAVLDVAAPASDSLGVGAGGDALGDSSLLGVSGGFWSPPHWMKARDESAAKSVNRG